MDANENKNPLEVTSARYSVPASNMAKLSDKIAKLARKAAKLGLPAIELKEVGAEERPVLRKLHRSADPENFDVAEVRYTLIQNAEELAKLQKTIAREEEQGRGGDLAIVYMKYLDLELTGAVPRLAGWDFVATLQHLDVDGETANMLRIVPGFEATLPERFRTATPENCDHCHTQRARKDTFVVRNVTTGEFKQVGRNCTQAFLGGIDPHDVAKYLEYFHQAAEACGFGGGGFGGGAEDRAEMGEFLAWVAACVRIDGWISRGKARAMDGQVYPTANQAFDFVCPPIIRDSKAAAKFAQARREHTPTAEDREVASKALAYAADDLEGKIQGNDYLHNLWVACNQTAVNHRLAGISASLISHYLKEVERQVLKEIELKRVGDSKHVGTVGERRFFQVTVLKVIVVGLDSQWGPSSLHKMVDADGNLVVWFASGEGDNLKPGMTYWLKATVKKHDTRDNVQQTVLSRADVVTEEYVKAEQEKAARKAARAAKKATGGR